ncbi:MAG: S41 family peptidase, partial [Candidatus Cloacimonetes bacterium]|nr:S41 family peptidase [Candidatus Cloacimonadota bacterium]
DDIFFPTLSPADKSYFLLGKGSWTKVDSIDVLVNKQKVTLPLHRAKETPSNNSGILTHTKHGNIDILKSSTFADMNPNDPLAREKELNRVEEICKPLRDSDQIIWDIHDNPGGDSTFPQRMVCALNDNATWDCASAVLISPVIEQMVPEYIDQEENITERYWKIYAKNKDNETAEETSSTYNGTIYALIGTRTASSGEAALSMLKNVKNVVKIGTNTGGACTVGNVITYSLPHSKTRLVIPCQLYLDGTEEGVGHLPDFWMDSNDLLEEVIKWLGERKDV